MKIETIDNIANLTASWISQVYWDFTTQVVPKLQELWIDIQKYWFTYIQDLYTRYVQYLFISNILGLILWIIVFTIVWLFLYKLFNEYKTADDSGRSSPKENKGVALVFLCIVQFLVVIFNFCIIDELVKLKTIPEIIVAKDIWEFKKYIDNNSN